MTLKKELMIEISKYNLIELDDIYKYKNVQYKMYAILSLDKVNFISCYEKDSKYFQAILKNKYYTNSFLIDSVVFDSKYIDEMICLTHFPKEYLRINDNDYFDAYEYYLSENKILDFEIEYIGISTKNNSCIRLSEHSTLQKILIDNQCNYLNKYFFVLLFDAEYSIGKGYTIESKEEKYINELSSEVFDEIHNFYDDSNVVRSLAEAILINSFKPKYNVEYKESDFSKVFKSFNSIYNENFNIAEIGIRFKKELDDKIIKLFTETKRITLSKDKNFVIVKCPFTLKNE